MASIVTSVCDRCECLGRQLVPVMGKELCPSCIESVRLFVTTKPLSKTRGKRTKELMDHVVSMVRANGYASSDRIADALGRDQRKTYFSLKHLCKLGQLEHKKNDVFVLPGKAIATMTGVL